MYLGDRTCIGKVVRFGYSVRVQDEWVTGLVTVTVVEPPAVPPPEPHVSGPAGPAAPGPAVTCDLKDRSWRAIKIEGGRFEKANAPPEIADFVRLIDADTLTVEPFLAARSCSRASS